MSILLGREAAITNVFVLSTGRCGSTTFIRAASHMTNFTAGHEGRSRMVGDERMAFPADHIEADNRLSWMLGRLDRAYGESGRYVHLMRDPAAAAKSFEERRGVGIIAAYRSGILMNSAEPWQRVCEDYVATVTTNIQAFLNDKPHTMTFRLENAKEDWPAFWEWIGAQGDLAASMEEWNTAHNSGFVRRGIRGLIGKK